MIKFFVYINTHEKTAKKPVFSSRKYRESYLFFKEKIKENQNNVYFPKKFVSNPTEVKQKKYYIYIVKEVNKIPTLLDIHEYLVEERFYVYGLKKRLTVVEILDQVFFKYSANFTKIYILKNKLVFVSGEDIECILTKNLDEAKRLYNYFKGIIASSKIIAFLFLGVVRKKKLKGELIKRLVELTGLSPFQFVRNSTRH